MDYIKPGIVDWKKRVKTVAQQSKDEAKRFQEVLGNCNYAVELGKKLNFVLVGIGGLLYTFRAGFTILILQVQIFWGKQDPGPSHHLAADESLHTFSSITSKYSMHTNNKLRNCRQKCHFSY